MRAQQSTIVGVFEDRQQADRAVDELRWAGFRDDQIGVAMRYDHGEYAGEDAADAAEGTQAGTGAVTGALAGLGLGALAGLGVLSGVVPVIGPAIAAGTLGVILTNAAAGAGIGGLVGVLAGAGIPEDEANYYQGEFEAGRAIVTVQPEGRADEVRAILDRYHAYDMSSRAGVAGYDQAATRTAITGRSGSTRGTAASREGDTIRVKEERLHTEKHPVEVGEVRVRKEVHTETKTLEVPVQREEAIIERTPVHGRAAAENIAGDAIREGEEIRIPVREEQVNVGKRVVQDTQRVSGDVRKEEVKVEQTGGVDVRSRGPGKKSS